jgi:hypothetical protein
MSQHLKKKVFGAIPLAFEFWADFEFAQLHQNMRQKDDPIFAEMLDRIRFGNPTEDDIIKLQSKVLTIPTGADRLENAVNVFDQLCQQNNGILCLIPTVSETDRFNKIMSAKKKIETIDIEAEDSNASSRQLFNREPNYKNPRNLKAKKKTNATAGLETNLHVGVGSRVMLRRNLDTQLGLVNGAIGTIIGFLKHNSKKDYITKIKVKFDQINEECEIERCVSDYEYQKNVYIARAQFPFTLAWAITIHKAQGLSLNSVLIDLGTGIFQGGMAYVALSRARKLANVHLIDFDPGSLFCSKRAFDEYKRLAEKFPQYAFNLPDFCNQLPTQYAHLTRSETNIDNNQVNQPQEINREKQKLMTIHNYPIKFFIQNDNNSYSNCIVQMIIHLNGKFREYTNLSKDQQQNSFKFIFNHYYDMLFKENKPRADSGLLRKYVHQLPNTTDKNDLNSFKKNAYSFLIDFIQRLPVELRRFFEFQQSVKKKCICGQITSYSYQSTIQTNLHLDSKNKHSNFYHSFTHLSNVKCDECNLTQMITSYSTYKIPDDNHFIIVYVPTFDASKKFLNSVVNNYDEDSIYLPIDIDTMSKIRYRIHSIIVRQIKNNEDGHYQIWLRNLTSNGWIYIYDESSRKYMKLYNNLKNIECFILEKCTN